MTHQYQVPPLAPEPVLEINHRGTKVWKVDGILHREDGPAAEYVDGTKYWCHHGRLHREDGPAVEFPDGESEWWLNNQYFSKYKWLREVLKDRPLTTHQRELLNALIENWAGTPELLYGTVTHLDPDGASLGR